MADKLRGSNGECYCSTCYESVQASSMICASCGERFESEGEGILCQSCGKLIGRDEDYCPLCNEPVQKAVGEESEQKPTLHMDGPDEAFLTKLLSWSQSTPPPKKETVEDKQEREQAMKILRTLTTVDTDEVIEERVKDIRETARAREELERRRKQLLKLGKPFETILERNIISINLIDKELAEIETEMRKTIDMRGKQADIARDKLKAKKEELKLKKDTLVAYEQNILMIGGAYRKLLERHQNELYKVESELKKRVEAFQKEVGRRRKQREKLKKREESLDKREMEISDRFLELKSRENEISVREENLKKAFEELESAQKQLEMASSSGDSNQGPGTGIAGSNESHNSATLASDFGIMPKIEEGEFMRLEENLREREAELDALKGDIEELKGVIIEKDKEIESIKANEPESTLDEDTRRILKILDDLLENLPEEVVDKFARSDDYLLYEKVLEKYKL